MKAKINLIDYKNTTIKISGSKNSALPIICASILCDEDVLLHNVPNIYDVNVLLKIINSLGFKTTFSNNTLKIKHHPLKKNITLKKHIKKLRASYYLVGSLISKVNNLKILYPGGCNFTKRPINYHLDAFSNMKKQIKITKKYMCFSSSTTHANHDLLYPSVGCTINIILASCKIKGTSIITNASIEPEVIDVCSFLNSMGANINVNKDNNIITIIGTPVLHKTEYSIISDRIEAGTFLILGAMHDGITITNVNHLHLTKVIDTLKEIGLDIITNNSTIILKKEKKLKPFNISLLPYPAFPTDLGPQMASLATQIDGTSTICDLVFKGRISHTEELEKMNANISVSNNIIKIKGKSFLTNTTLEARDLRCCASIVLASSLNTFPSTIKNVEILFRGYENIREKLKDLGINFTTRKIPFTQK